MSNAVIASQAAAAYELNYTGAGIKIGIVDSGINPALSEFAGRIDPASRDVAGTRGLGDDDGHGTAVSAVAAAANDGQKMQGLAYDATIFMARADAPGTCASSGGCDFYDSAIAAGVDAARMAGVKVINLSLGGSPPGSSLMSAMSRAVSAGIILVIAAGNDGRTAAGNNADPFALVPAQNFPGQVIIAGSIGAPDGMGGTNLDQLSDFSNKAGTGANWYLAALGYRDLTIDNTGQLYYYSGTSFSAPTITGAVALLAQAFPSLSPAQLVGILFDSADDLGAAGVDSIYGHGRLNLARAFQPLGKTSLADGKTAVGSATTGELPGAAGDGGTTTDPNPVQGGLGVIILDGYSRAFTMNLAAGLRAARADQPLQRALGARIRTGQAAAGPIAVSVTMAERPQSQYQYELAQLHIGPEDAQRSRLAAATAVARLSNTTAVALGFAEGAKAMERRLSGAQAGAFLIARDIAGEPGFAANRSGSVALRREIGKLGGLTVSGEQGEVARLSASRAQPDRYRFAGVTFDKQVGSNWLSLGVSRLDEQQTVLGGHLGAAFGGGGKASTTFADVEARRELGSGFTAALSARRGWTSFAGGKFTTAAYAFDLQKYGMFNQDDRIGLRVAQPLRIERGGLGLMLPTGYDYASRTATNSWQSWSLTPSGREIDTEVSYARPLAGGWVSGNLFYRKDPGHVAKAQDDVGAAIRFTLGF